MLTQQVANERHRGVSDPAAQAALTSFFSVAGPGPAAQLLQTARVRTVQPGVVLVRDEETDRAGVLIEGMLRTVVSLPDGRSATIHYPRPVAFFALPTVFFPVPLSVHVARKATIVDLDSGELRRCAREFPDFGWFLSRHLAGAVRRVPSIIEEFGFKTVTQRVAAHLISLSEPEGATGQRTAAVSQTALAEYVGTAREVVSRSLRMLSDERLITVARGSIRITDVARLERVAGAGDTR